VKSGGLSQYYIDYYYYYYYYYYILHLSAKRYEELLAIRLGKPFMDKNPRHPSFAPLLCSPCDEAGALTSVVPIGRSAAEAAAPFCIRSCSYLPSLS
jgi:hypothetical protein